MVILVEARKYEDDGGINQQHYCESENGLHHGRLVDSYDITAASISNVKKFNLFIGTYFYG